MAGKIDARLAELGITLPTPMPPIANYVPFVINGNTVVISGQVPAPPGDHGLPHTPDAAWLTERMWGELLALSTLPTFGLGTATLAWTALEDPSRERRGWHDRKARSIVVEREADRPLGP